MKLTRFGAVVIPRALTLYVAGQHLCWAVMLAFGPEPLRTAPIFTFTIYSEDYRVLAAYFALVGIAAVLEPLLLRFRYAGLLLVPQQATLFVTAWGAWSVIRAGRYADGYDPGSWRFIAADQWPQGIWLAFWHFIVILYLYATAARTWTARRSGF